jgi:hypothetical protein
MLTRSTYAAALLFALPAAASAQTAAAPGDHGRPGIVVFANGGGYSPLTNLNDAGTADIKTGWTGGGGVGVQLNRYVAVRGVFDFAQGKGRGTGAGTLAGQKLKHYFYGGDIQLRYPTQSGFAPYLLAGAGAVTIDDKDDPTFTRFTKLAGKGGIGVEYAFPTSGLGLYAQAASYGYKWDRLGFNKTQFDVLWTGGVSYRF